jgi:hypothetical protein
MFYTLNRNRFCIRNRNRNRIGIRNRNRNGSVFDSMMCFVYVCKTMLLAHNMFS